MDNIDNIVKHPHVNRNERRQVEFTICGEPTVNIAPPHGIIHFELLFLPLMYTNSNRKNIEIIGYDGKLPSFREMLGVVLTFAATCIAWIFFRADSLAHAWSYIDRMLTLENIEAGMPLGYKVMPYILMLLLFEWFHRRRKHALENLSWILPVRWFFYYCIA